MSEKNREKVAKVAIKAYVAIARGHKILSTRSRTQRIFLVNTFSGRVPVP